MKYLRHGLGALLMICIVIRVAAWLLAPALPMVIVLFVAAALLSFMIRGHFRDL